MGVALLHEGVHLRFLRLHLCDQVELGAAAVQVLAFPVGAEIDVPLQEIREESQAAFEGEESLY